MELWLPGREAQNITAQWPFAAVTLILIEQVPQCALTEARKGKDEKPHCVNHLGGNLVDFAPGGAKLGGSASF